MQVNGRVSRGTDTGSIATSPLEIPMTALTAARLRLLTLREQLRDRLRRLQADRGHEQQALSADFAEQAVERENDEVLDRLDEASRADLASVEAALERIEQGRYGLCEHCGSPIESPRLRSMPQATSCAPCATARAPSA